MISNNSILNYYDALYDENLIGFFDLNMRKKILKKSGIVIFFLIYFKIESYKKFDHKICFVPLKFLVTSVRYHLALQID